MTLKDAIQEYLNKESTAIELIRQLTASVNPNHAVDILALINQITRLESGDLDEDTFKSVWELN